MRSETASPGPYLDQAGEPYDFLWAWDPIAA